jgi:Tfp pilus assembly PilM family ATPase
MAEELKSPLAYASQLYPDEGIKKILLIGDGAVIPGVSQYLADNLGIVVTAAAPSDVVAPVARASLDGTNTVASPFRSNVQNPALTVAVGLAKFAARLSQ